MRRQEAVRELPEHVDGPGLDEGVPQATAAPQLVGRVGVGLLAKLRDLERRTLEPAPARDPAVLDLGAGRAHADERDSIAKRPISIDASA